MADLFDNRLYRIIDSDSNKWWRVSTPHSNNILSSSGETFIYEYYETPWAAAQAPYLKQVEGEAVDETEVKDASNRAGDILLKANELNKSKDFYAPYSAIHPFALIRLAGGYGQYSGHTVDTFNRRKFYEIDGNSISGNTINYAANPTTTALINWGNQDEKGRFPYSFQDFVFCKYWNKIENNRLITLRRYPTPVVDAVIPSADYKDLNPNISKQKNIGPAPIVYSPVCTAVTYFGEGTDNKLSDILKFSVGYEWEEIKGDVWGISSQQPEEGGVLGQGPKWLNSGLAHITRALGILGDLQGKGQIIPTDAVGLPPDPYTNGPYENRILGPINVIDKVMKRNRGLKFSNDGLTITFSYIARPIANINNKAILLDLLANILMMTSASGTFFGGLRRYRTEKPAVYPWKSADALNKLYKGQLFGKNSAASSLMREAWGENGSFITNFAKDLLNDIKAVAGDILSSITGKGGGFWTSEDKKYMSDAERKKVEEEEEAEGRAAYERKKKAKEARDRLKDNGNKIGGTMGRAVAAHLLKGATIPWITGMKALLTGEPVGEWHLTVGNPLNPIAMIGNLIVDNCEVTFSDELGPDDFPIGFTAKITLKHGMGRDKDAVESMFNRGTGRIYMLSDSFKTSADKETKVDNYTGGTDGRFNIDWFEAKATSGRDYVHSFSNPQLPNRNNNEYSKVLNHNLDLSRISFENFISNYRINPWTMHWIL